MSGVVAAHETTGTLPVVEGRTWVRGCAKDDVPDDEGVVIASTPPVSVFTSGGEFFCIDDTCTHEDYSLAEGWVEDCVVECTLHMAKFCLRTGAVLGPPATQPIPTHPVAVVGEEIYLALPTTYTA